MGTFQWKSMKPLMIFIVKAIHRYVMIADMEKSMHNIKLYFCLPVTTNDLLDNLGYEWTYCAMARARGIGLGG